MLQNAPMYSDIPAKDVARARKFYEEKLGVKPSWETAGGVTYEFGKGTPETASSVPPDFSWYPFVSRATRSATGIICSHRDSSTLTPLSSLRRISLA
jgi:catechol 2,3-dioxygenase-like lactoylglutathione lyase family enzyme